jgi:hypothetical protein
MFEESTTPEADQRSVILASCENRHAAELMPASRGRGCREKARPGHATALAHAVHAPLAQAAQFFARLDPGSRHDWLHVAVGEPS